MSTMRGARWLRYIRFWGDDPRADVDDEIAFHLEQLTAYYVRSGVPPSEARELAGARFGNYKKIARAMDRLAQQRERQMRRTELVEAFTRDIRYALRQLRQRPGFTLVALVTLAFGIGVNTAIFSAVDAVLLHPVATRNIDRVMVVQTNLPKLPLIGYPVGPGEALDLMRRVDLYDASGAWAARGGVLTERGAPQWVTVARTMGRFFDVFRIAPAAGRFYRTDESRPGNEHVTVLSYAFWQELGGDQALIGKSLVLNGDRYEVIGVAPKGFEYPRDVQVFVPVAITPQLQQNRGQMIWNVVGRIKSGLTRAQFEAGVQNEQQRWHKDYNEYEQMQQYLSVLPLVTMIAGQLRPVLIALLCAVAFVLLIACANIASLQIVHGASRSRELAIRAALGAGRGTIVRQLLVENLVLAIAGGALGIALGAGILKTMGALGAAEIPALDHVTLNAPVLAFSTVATIVAGLLFGLIPALRVGRVNVNGALRDGTRNASFGSRHGRLLQGSVVVQIALTLVLLLGSGLMIRSLRALLAQSPGFRPEHVQTIRLSAMGPRYRQRGALTSFYDELLTKLRALPAVSAVGFVSELPFSGQDDSNPFTIRGRAPDPSMPAMHANLHTIGGEYFRAMGIPLLRGRYFDKSDAPTRNHGAAVAIIDETLAKTWFPHEDPIGKVINQGSDAMIVGVVGGVSQFELGETAKATVYYPYTQHDWYSSMYVVERTALPLGTVTPMLRNVVSAVDPTVPVYEPRTLESRISGSLAPRRLAMVVLTGLAALSLGLALSGLYGVISYAVSQRTQEFGIRIALGAQAADLRRMVIGQALALAAVGVVLGIVVGLAATKALASLLFGVSVHDRVTFVGVCVLLAAIAVVASYVPARRATHVDPLDALRAS